MLPPASTHITKCEALWQLLLMVVRALGSPATTLVIASTYNVKIIASFNFHAIAGTVSRDEHIGTCASGILGNIVVLCDNVIMENGDVSR